MNFEKKVNSFSDFSEIEKKNLEKKLKNGDLIIYPTDTVYGLAAIIDSELAINNIYLAKSRKFSSPLIALLSSTKYIEKIAYLDEKKDIVEKLANAFWPGALTIILRKKEIVPSIMVSNGDTVGIRIPNLELALKIIELAGGILPTTSANISGEESPKSFIELSQKIKNKVDILIDGGKCNLGEVSTIIDLSKDVPKLIRKGAINTSDIEKIIGRIER